MVYIGNFIEELRYLISNRKRKASDIGGRKKGCERKNGEEEEEREECDGNGVQQFNPNRLKVVC